ncbi:MAG: hypothetical protein Q4D78_05725 [Neisseria zoodegmatis]|uniref:hypothetical protein n=1 Tax=Neisseria zoodegmatis TaxID=326523 RepID=UPI0026EABE18|nr:hypothetical protein [Neisseria zoodegmatis]MDO5069686.1 hypothetical protein [Neisseria zoodegmatis]
MSEPSDEPRARVRISANMLIKGVPDSDCLDWQKAGAGTIFGGLVGSKGYRKRVIGMPNPQGLPAKHSGEFYVRAGKPVAFQLINTPESRMRCEVAFSFVPEVGRDYDIVMGTEVVEEGKRRMLFKQKYSLCTAQVFDITTDNIHKVAVSPAGTCRR